MKFTSEDLLKAMGLKVGDRISFRYNVYEVLGGSYYDCLRRTNGVASEFLSLVCLFNENFEIIQSKPTLTEDEKVILRNLPKKFHYIVRNELKDIKLFFEKPERENNGICNYWEGTSETAFMFNHLFQFIKWEDEPYSIEELLKE